MKKYFFLMLFIAIGFSALAQTNSTFTQTADNFWRMEELKDGTFTKNHTTIAGNPYLNKEFQDGKLISKYNLTFPVIPLRYNIYTDNVEYKSAKNKIFALNGHEKIKGFVIDDTTFLFSPYFKNKDKLSSGYFQVLVSGEVTGLLKYTVYLMEAQSERPYTPAKPERFSPRTMSFYLKVGDKPAVSASKEKDILHLFPKQKSQLNKFFKKEHIHLQKQADFVKLVKYINTFASTKAESKK
jgi:hypothetical protein